MWWRPWVRRPPIWHGWDADFNVVLYPEIAGRRRVFAEAQVRPEVRPCATVPIGVGATHGGIHRGSCRSWPGSSIRRVAGRPPSPDAVVLALGRLELPDRQARVRVRRRDPRDCRGARGQRGTGLHRGWTGHLQPRIRPRGARGGCAIWRRAADHRRLSGSGSAAIAAACSPSWCWARRWSATSPSGWAFPAR